jgi:predicted DsbA family dithiol-disulfide isomerase
MAEDVRFWIDPICPWCWVTSRFVRSIADDRELSVTWEPISLFVKNSPAADTPYYETSRWSHGLLRVLESVRAKEGDDAVGALYLEYGRRIHHDGERQWPASAALQAIGLDEIHAQAADDETWDEEIARRMDAGLALVGNDVGTPIISVQRDDREVALFGPVITRVPERDASLALWDASVMLAGMDEFFELKRSRSGRPQVGERP